MKVYVLILKCCFGVLFTFNARIRVVLQIADHINVYRDLPELSEPIKVMVVMWQSGIIKG